MLGGESKINGQHTLLEQDEGAWQRRSRANENNRNTEDGTHNQPSTSLQQPEEEEENEDTEYKDDDARSLNDGDAHMHFDVGGARHANPFAPRQTLSYYSCREQNQPYNSGTQIMKETGGGSNSEETHPHCYDYTAPPAVTDFLLNYNESAGAEPQQQLWQSPQCHYHWNRPHLAAVQSQHRQRPKKVRAASPEAVESAKNQGQPHYRNPTQASADENGNAQHTTCSRHQPTQQQHNSGPFRDICEDPMSAIPVTSQLLRAEHNLAAARARVHSNLNSCSGTGEDHAGSPTCPVADRPFTTKSRIFGDTTGPRVSRLFSSSTNNDAAAACCEQSTQAAVRPAKFILKHGARQVSPPITSGVGLGQRLFSLHSSESAPQKNPQYITAVQ